MDVLFLFWGVGFVCGMHSVTITASAAKPPTFRRGAES